MSDLYIYIYRVGLQVSEGGQVEEPLDELGGAGRAQPQEEGMAILQEESPALGQTLLRAAQRRRHTLALQLHVVLRKDRKC